MDTPLVSVVVASVTGLASASRCLDALVPQQSGVAAEIVVVDRCGEETRAALRSRFPDVLVVAAAQTALRDMRAQGLAQARGQVLAVLADRFVADPGWLAAVEREYRAGRLVVAGPIEHDSAGRLVDWAVFFCEYAPFMPPLSAGPVERLPGNNVAYERSVLERVATSLAQGAWDGALHDCLRAAGVALWIAPEMRVTLFRRYSWRAALAQRYHAGRAFAGARLDARSWWTRLVYAGATPLLPPLLLLRIIASVARSRRQVPKLLAATPLVVLLLLAGVGGEATGALRGVGDSLERLD